MKKIICGLLLGLPTIAAAQPNDDIIRQRQQAFAQIETEIEQTDALLSNREVDWDSIEKVSSSLLNHSETLQISFPIGSQSGSKTKQAVWDKPEKFNNLLLEMNDGFELLQQASSTRDHNAASKGLEMAQDTCRSCHRSYRSRF